MMSERKKRAMIRSNAKKWMLGAALTAILILSSSVIRADPPGHGRKTKYKSGRGANFFSAIK
jgi:hypothetical protein